MTIRNHRCSTSIFQCAARTLGGAPRLLTKDEIEKMSPEAQNQLLDVLQRMEERMDNPSPAQVMKLIARGRVPLG
jgi:hypothetical protein